MRNTKVITKVNPYLRLATEQDCIRLAPNLRKEDFQEIKADKPATAKVGLHILYFYKFVE